jgi:hypothetical protein
MKKTNSLLAMLLFSTAYLGIFSCTKQSTSENKQITTEKAVEKNKVEQLAVSYTQPIDPTYATLKKEFANLTETQLKTFYLTIYKINNKGKATISEDQFVKQFEKYFSDSKMKYNRPFNKLSLNEMVNIISPVEYNRTNNQNRVILPPDEDPDCPFLPYPYYFYWASNPNAPYSPSFVSWRLVDFYSGDCNGYELTYNGFWNRLRAITPYGAQAIALFLQGDYIPGKTRVLHKKSSADYWFGNVYNINNHIRMAAEAEE